MSGYLDLEKFVCFDQVNRPDLAGVIDRAQYERPWFRAFLPQALQKIQRPYYTPLDRRRELLWDGNWRGVELTTKANDPTYKSTDTEGIDYPAGYKLMRYVYLVDSQGNVGKVPLRSVTEEGLNTQELTQSDRSPWFGFADWDWWGWNESWQTGRVRWMDNNGKFYLTWTPQQTLILRMVYHGEAVPPTEAEYTNNKVDWFTTNLFFELAALVEAMIWKAGAEDQKAASAMKDAEQLIGDAWRLNQSQKAGSNSRVYVPAGPGAKWGTRGW